MQKTIEQLYLNRLGALTTILAAIVVGNSSAARRAIEQLERLLSNLFGSVAESLPVKLISWDSPTHLETGHSGMTENQHASSPIAEFSNYPDFTVGELMDRAMEYPGTRYIAEGMTHLQRSLSSAHGCSQDPAFGLACFTASVPARDVSWRKAILATRDEARLATCSRNGIKVLISKRIPVIDIDNFAGSTGKSALIPNLVLGHHSAEQLGVELAPFVFGLLSSASVSGDPEAVRNNAAACILETAFAASRHSDQCVVRTFEGREIKHTKGPVIDAIVPVAVSSDYQAATSRDQLALRVAFQVLVLLCTPALLEIQKLITDARSKSINHRQDGFPFIWRMGLARRFCSEELSQAVTVEEATRCFINRI